MVSVMHIADMHLGTKISQFSPDKNISRMIEIQNTALSALKQAGDYDIVLFPGDVFDLQDTSEKIADVFLKTVSKYKNTMFFYSCGNHDPYVSPVVDYCVRNCPSNLYIFGYEEVECVTLEALKTKVYGISFYRNHTPETLVKIKEKCDDDYLNILCVHGVLGIDLNEPYNPVSLKNIADNGFDYVALGHVHTYSGILKYDSTYYAYSGTPEPRRYGETGEKGIICGTLDKNENNLMFKALSKRQYIEHNIDISKMNDYASLVFEISSLITDNANIYHFILHGVNNISNSLNTELLVSNLNAYGVKISDLTHSKFSVSDYIEDITLKGECARETVKLCENSEESERELYEKACLLIFDILDGRGDNNEY